MPGPIPYALNPEDVQDTWDELMIGAANRGITYADILNADATNEMSVVSWARIALLPEDNIDSPLRYHDQGSNTPTAAIGMRTPYAINWQQQPVLPSQGGATPGINQQLGPSDMAIFSFDYSPLHILSIYDPNPNYSPITYKWTWCGHDKIFFNPTTGRIRANKALSDATQVGNYAAHGTWLYCKRDSLDNRYFWVDAIPGSVNGAGTTTPTTIRVFTKHQQNSGSTEALYSVTLTRYYNGDPQTVDTLAVSANSPNNGVLEFVLNRNTPDVVNNLATTYSDFYTLTATRLATTDNGRAQLAYDMAQGFNVTQSSVCSTLKNIAMHEVEVLLSQMSSKSRILAQGVRITDVAMLQYVNGQIVGATAWDDYTWYDYFQVGLQKGRAFFDAVAQIPGAIPGDLWDGGYIYHKGTQATDYDWRATMSWDPKKKEPDDYFVPIETNRPVKIIACTAANDNTVGNPTGGGAACYLTVATMLEWIPPVSCVEVRMSEWTRNDCAAGCDMLGMFPDFTSNDTHWSEFASQVFKTAGAPILKAAIRSGGDWLAKKFPSSRNVVNWMQTAGNGAVDAVVKELGGSRKRGGKRAR